MLEINGIAKVVEVLEEAVSTRGWSYVLGNKILGLCDIHFAYASVLRSLSLVTECRK